MSKHNTPKTPLPEPMSGLAVGSFAYKTITKRFPKIVRQVLADNNFNKEVSLNLKNLIQDIPLTTLRSLLDTSAPDLQDWQDYLTPYRDMNWLQVPWFVAEMYFYRRILEAIGYYQLGSYQGYDPFLMQKQLVLESANDPIRHLGKQLDQFLNTQNKGESIRRAELQELLVLNVWGNQADLSMWSASEDRPDHQNSNDQQSHLLVDDTEMVINYLIASDNKKNRLDFILDNYGPELVYDIGLADYLLSTQMVSKILFHAKPCPHYVSDAMIKDVHATIDYLANDQDNSVKELAQRMNEYIHAGRLEIKEDFFWTSPLYFWDMPEYILQELSKSDLVISKGDANYRRLTGDLNWSPTTPFTDVVRYFPSPLLALRVLKAELALGLTSEKVQELEKQEPDWRFSGNWAVIQFFKP